MRLLENATLQVLGLHPRTRCMPLFRIHPAVSCKAIKYVRRWLNAHVALLYCALTSLVSGNKSKQRLAALADNCEPMTGIIHQGRALDPESPLATPFRGKPRGMNLSSLLSFGNHFEKVSDIILKGTDTRRPFVFQKRGVRNASG